MVTLKERLAEDMKSALKQREAGKQRLSVIQLVRAAILQVEKDKQVELDDQGVTEVIAREVKQRQEAIAEYEKFNARDAIEKLESEIAILREYLPQPLTHDELCALIREAIQATGARGLRDMGKVMGMVIPQTRGRADGKIVNQMVKEMLSQ